MKVNIKLLTIVAGILCITTSCKQFIDVDDPIDQINAADVYADKNTAYAALDQLYTELQTNSLYSGGSSGAGVLLGSYTDDLELYSPTLGSSTSDVYLNQLLADNSIVRSVWANAYKEIYMANALIEGVERSSLAEQDKKQITGEALVIRSMIYLDLMQIYSDIPYTTTTDYVVNQKLHKTPEAGILQLLEADLSQAIGMLPDEYRNPDRIYVNKKVGELVLSTIYQLQNKWTETEQICRSMISTPEYSFQNDITKVFKKGGKHILFQLKTLYAGAPTPEAGIYYFSTVPPQNYVLSPQLVAAFSDNDLRRSHWISKIEGNGLAFFRNDKYKNTDTNSDEYSVVYRLESVYLMLAESLARQDRTGEAIPYVNKIRQRAGIPLLNDNITKEDLLTEISEERRREFFGEQGQRFFDLKRLGKLNILKPQKSNWQDFHQRWPLPASEMLLNTNLNPQNLNY
ncbi:RagB/SusD family nutrient uptake outer membrane protein [Chryseobacterium salivictor]|uniref:SusD family n=1 Tax=Chryseobacterium salivictor TaxID=2547600 RepID=A0A4P6ZIU4_9FLAO|nr:RagB/SusD family nutrient uptake outer membrane protein [Chryseobacterium salivictor]QBO59345.1 hypothetical protein NBC122_02541 [Chryseobacterium salivictor]